MDGICRPQIYIYDNDLNTSRLHQRLCISSHTKYRPATQHCFLVTQKLFMVYNQYLVIITSNIKRRINIFREFFGRCVSYGWRVLLISSQRQLFTDLTSNKRRWTNSSGDNKDLGWLCTNWVRIFSWFFIHIRITLVFNFTLLLLFYIVIIGIQLQTRVHFQNGRKLEDYP